VVRYSLRRAWEPCASTAANGGSVRCRGRAGKVRCRPPVDNDRPRGYDTTTMPRKKRKTARLRAARKHKARKKQERKSGHARVKGGRKRK
jgi:hypothetical protein